MHTHYRELVRISAFFISLIISNFCFSQTQDGFDYYYQKADSLYDAFEESLAIEWVEKAANHAKKESNIENEVKALLLKSICQAYLDEGPQAKATIQKILDKKALFGLDSILTAAIYHRKGVVHYILGEYHDSNLAYEQALLIREKKLGQKHLDYQNTAFNLGTNLFQDSKYYSAQNRLEEVFQTIENEPSHPYYNKSLYELAKVYREIGDFERSESCFEKILNGHYENRTLSIDELGNIYVSLAIGKSNQLKHEEALMYYDSAVNYLHDKSEISLADIQNNQGGAWHKLKDYEKSIQLFHHALNNYQDPTDLELARCYTNLGLSYALSKEFTQAKKYVFLAKSKAQNHYPSNHPDLAIYERNIAAYYKNLGQLDSALLYTIQAIDKISLDFKKRENIHSNSNILNGPIDRLSEIAVEKVEIQFEQWKNQDIPEAKYLLQYIEDLEYVEQLLSYWTLGQQSNHSKLFWRSQATQIYSLGLKICEQANNHQIDVSRKAYKFMERSKNMLLVQQVQSQKVKRLGGIPASILEQEVKLKAEIQELSKSIFFRTKELSPDISDSLFAKKEALIALRENYGNEYPAFTSDSLANLSSLDEVQLKLGPEELMFLYHASDSGVFLLAISQFQTNLVNLGDPISLKDQISSYFSLVSDIPSSTIDYQSHLNKLSEVLFNLSKVLLPKGIDYGKQIIIVPDAWIGFVSFHTLLTDRAEGNSTKNWPYLWRNHSISYDYSASLWVQQEKNDHSPITHGISVGPLFEESTSYPNSRSFHPLKYNVEEAKTIASLWNLKPLTGANATKNEATKYFKQASIIHLASHATINEDDNAFSYIAFSKDSKSEENSLFLGELSQYGVHAKLIVLSACETGIGTHNMGEGISSIARGFYGAGAQSILASLWSVNDKSTNLMMTTFYSELKKGINKRDAWQNAISTYFETHDNFQCHPYFWGGFLPLGDMSIIELKSSPFPSNLIIFCSLILLIGIVTFWYKKRL